MENKVMRVTKAQRFEDIKALLTGEEVKYGTTIETAIDTINHELELLAKKNTSTSKKQIETQKLNAQLKDEIVELLNGLDEDNPGLTCSEIIDAKEWWKTCSTSKMSALMRQLKEDGRVKPKTVKGRTLFTLA